MNIKNQYPIPVYLNQSYVFDVLAMMEDGFSQVKSIKETRNDQQDKTFKVSGEVGVTNAFALLGVKFGGEREAKNQVGQSQEFTEEKVHTPNSLFSKMRNSLHQEDVVKSNLDQVEAGDFVEFQIILRKNPMVQMLENLKTILRMAEWAEDPQPKPKNQKAGQSENNQVKVMIESFLGEMQEGAFDLIGKVDSGGGDLNVVVTMDKNFINDASLSNIIDGQYTILGKVTKMIKGKEDEKINLLRKTSFAMLPASSFDAMKEMTLQKDGALSMPELITEVNAPAIQVVPIAIFS